jgi:hypothetical protein
MAGTGETHARFAAEYFTDGAGFFPDARQSRNFVKWDPPRLMPYEPDLSNGAALRCGIYYTFGFYDSTRNGPFKCYYS